MDTVCPAGLTAKGRHEAGRYLGDVEQDLHGAADDLHARDAAVTAPDQHEYRGSRSAPGHVLTAKRRQPGDHL